MNARHDILHGGLSPHHTVLVKREPCFYTLCVVNKGEERGVWGGGEKKEPRAFKVADWGDSKGNSFAFKKRFEALLSHQARLITRKIDLYSERGSSMYFVLLCGLLDRFLLRDAVWKGCWWSRGMMLMWRKCVRLLWLFSWIMTEEQLVGNTTPLSDTFLLLLDCGSKIHHWSIYHGLDINSQTWLCLSHPSYFGTVPKNIILRNIVKFKKTNTMKPPAVFINSLTQ